MRIDNGATRADQGRVDDADLVLSSRFEDFVDLTTQRRTPLELIARRRLRSHGSLRLLAGLPTTFAA